MAICAAATYAMPAASPGAQPAASTTPVPTATVAGCPAPKPGVQHYAPGSGKTVAFTFDDGPSSQTGKLLSLLRTRGVRATFFDLGMYEHQRPAMVRAQVADGHTVGDHTWDHDKLTLLTASGQAGEIDRAANEQLAITGHRPCLFRPPYGDYNATTLSLAAARGMSVYNWSVDPEDWKAAGVNTAYWRQRITARAEAGVTQTHPLILFHDLQAGTPATLAVLPTVISFYRRHGYRIVDLLGRSGLAPAASTGQRGPALAATRVGLHLVRRGDDGRLFQRVRRNGVWGAWQSLGGSVGTAPAAVATTPTTMVAFAVGAGGHLRARRVADDGSGGWSDLGGHAVMRPAAAAGPDGVLTVAVRNPGGGISIRQRVKGTWRAWQSLSGDFVAGPAVAETADGGLTVVAEDRAGMLWVRHRAPGGSGWTAWRRLAGTSTAFPAMTTIPNGTRLLLVHRGADGAMYVRTGTASAATWGGVRRLGGTFASAPSVTVRGSYVDVVAVGVDGVTRIDSANFSSGSAVWGGWRAVPSA